MLRIRGRLIRLEEACILPAGSVAVGHLNMESNIESLVVQYFLAARPNRASEPTLVAVTAVDNRSGSAVGAASFSKGLSGFP